MKKLLLSFILLTQLLFCATDEQIEHYLLVSNSDEQLLMLQEAFCTLKQDANISITQTKILTTFKSHLKKNLTQKEMQSILNNYNNFTLLQFVSATSKLNFETNATLTYIKEIKENNNQMLRTHLITQITQKFYNKEGLSLFFNQFLKPLITHSIKNTLPNEDINTSTHILNKIKQNYLYTTSKIAYEETLFATKEFSIEELQELLTLSQLPIVKKETLSLFDAMAYALKQLFTFKVQQ